MKILELIEQACRNLLWVSVLILAFQVHETCASQYGDFTYFQQYSTITISKYTGTATDLTIPATIDGLPVTSIYMQAFYRCSSLKNVVMSSNLLEIDDDAFSYCTGLTNITIPESVTRIGKAAFSTCSRLPKLKIPKNVTVIGRSPCVWCSALTNIVVDGENSQFTSVDGVLFNKNQTTLLQFPNGRSGSYSIPNGVIQVADYAFTRSEKLSALAFPSTLTTVASHSFSICDVLTDFSVDALNQQFSSIDGVLYDKKKTTLVMCPYGRIGTYQIPDGINQIGTNAFSGCPKLNSVMIPNSVTNIGPYAFYQCIALTNCTIASGTTKIGEYAFSACGQLRKIGIPNTVTEIGYKGFESCWSLPLIIIPPSVKTIGNYAFVGCSSLLSVYFEGDAPTNMGASCFETPQVIYYRAGAKGWGASIGGRATALWPIVSVQIGSTGTVLTWPQGVLLETTNLQSDYWATNTAKSPFTVDPKGPQKFYRLKLN